MGAKIEYESIDAATAAVNEMRGFALGGPGKRIKMDFADVPNMEPAKGYQGSDYDPNIASGGFGHRDGPGWGKRPGDDLDGPPSRMRRMEDDRPAIRQNGENGDGRGAIGGDGMQAAKSITDLAKRVDKAWEGGIILKNSMFPTKLLLTEGEREVVEQLLKDENDM